MLELNYSYLVRQKQTWPQNLHPIVKMKVLEITEKCYRIEWESGIRLWKLKTDFDQNFEIIEEIGNPLEKELYERFKDIKEQLFPS